MERTVSEKTRQYLTNTNKGILESDFRILELISEEWKVRISW